MESLHIGDEISGLMIINNFLSSWIISSCSQKTVPWNFITKSKQNTK
jgi:hypothetical protein